jgi:hypothetical protein
MKAMSKPKVKLLVPDWKSAFQGQVMRSSFCLALTQPMLEFLCAVADGVSWDRTLYYQQYGAARPDSHIASSGALYKRGLIQENPDCPPTDQVPWELVHQRSQWKLTPAGDALVELLKVAGIFIEADAAIVKKLAGKKGQ